ncbi:MAG: PLP-dependent aminotransferase family protein [bacterium]|nr:PLP-dependent aminotransferase family protein [bacterium]
MIQYDLAFSKNIKAMKRSVIRELLKVTQSPEIISFAGGLPSPESFPIEEIKKITMEVLEKNGTKALQYGATEGFPPLADELIKLMALDNVKIGRENLAITIASQQGLDLVGKIFFNPGDIAIVESPTYVGALSAFNSYRGKLVDVELDDDGMRIDILKKTLANLKKQGKKPKFIYVIPDFHNPAGVTLSYERRKQLIEIAKKEKIMIIEDSPYRMVRFRGKNIPSLYSMDKEGLVVSLFTFSKIFVPGFRLGWAIGPKEIIDKMIIAKQATDLSTPEITQHIAASFLQKKLLLPTVKKTVSIYEKKNKLMLEMLDKYMPKKKGVRWTKPDGGLFLWVTLPEKYDCDKIFTKAIEKKVAYVVGSAFYVGGKKKNSFRMNFSYPSMEQIKVGVKRLAEVIDNEIK